ncbi:Secretion system C-terminal sorting domain [Flavobacteriaceae bacterium]
MKKITLLITFLLVFMPKMGAQILFYENFDNPANWVTWTVGHPVGGELDLGWTNETVGANPTCSPALGSGMARFGSFDFDRDQYDLNSPAIAFTGGSYRVTLKMYRDNGYATTDDKIEVFFNTGPTSELGTTLGSISRAIGFAPVETATGWYSYTFNIPDNPTGDGFISILGTSAFGNNIYIDEIVVENVPSCDNPTGLVASGITSSGATVDWISPAVSPAIGYEYYYSTTNVTPTGAAMGTTAAGVTTATIATGLLPSTIYYFWVRSVCSGTETSSWSSSRSFTTACATITSLPWTENFDSLTTGTNVFPLCWDYVNTTSNWSISTFPTANSGANSLRRTYGTDGWAFTPLATLSALTSYTLSYYMRTNDEVVGYDITIGVGTGQSVTDMVTTLSTVTGHQGAIWTKFTYEFTPSIAGDYSFGVHVVAPFAPNGINFDDFKLEVTPSCNEPSLLVASSLTSTSAMVSWTAPSSVPANGYEYFLSTSNTAPTVSTVATGSVLAGITMVDLVSLTPATIYYVWVRSLCSPSDISSWSSSLSFVTECVAVTSFTENFDSALAFPTCWGRVGTGGNTDIRTLGTAPSLPNVMYLYGSSATSQGLVKTILVSNLGAGTNRLKFDMRANFTVGGIIEIGYLTNPNDASTFIALNSVTSNSLDFTQFIFSPPVGVYSEYLALRHTGAPALSVLIDNVVWEANPATVPTCASGITATINPTCGNFATEITWTAATDADGYKLNIGTTSGGTDIMNNQIVGNVLTYSFVGNANTTYYYTVLPYNFVGNAVGCSEQSLTTFASGCFCDSLPTSRDGVGITNVQLGTTDFPNGDVSYFDNTATPVSLARGINTNLQVSFDTGFGYTYNTNVWIDFNDNLTFESSELVYSGESLADPTTVLNASFIMPTLANLGSHRMRIGAADSGQLPPNPCYSDTYGVTLDYTVTIIEATCAPAAGVATLLSDCANNQFFVNVNVTALGSGTPSISNGTATWPITSIGNLQVGPFADGTSSNALVIVHGSDSTCDLPLGTFTYSCPPSNDECSSAIVLTPGGIFATNPLTGTILAATTTAGITPSCQATVSADVWYSVVVPASGTLTIETKAAATNTMTDSVVAAFSGACGALTQVGCNDDDGSGNMSILSLTGQTAGETLYVGVWKYGIAEPTAANSGFQIAAYDGSLSTNTFNSASFTYYPNPVKNTLNLSYSENISDVSVYNLLGQQVIAKAINANQSQIDMSHLTSGTYMVKVTANNQVKTIKVIKQ